MCTIALAKVQRNYNCYNVYFYECLPFLKVRSLCSTRLAYALENSIAPSYKRSPHFLCLFMLNTHLKG